MVVAQIPLWIIHGTTPTGVAAVSAAAAGGADGNSLIDAGASASGNTQNIVDDEMIQRGKNQFNMWSNSGGGGTIGGGGGGNQKQNDPFSKLGGGKMSSSTTERRSAIYCCDVSSTGGRIATGGGDGKIRIWNLNSLFQTSKLEPSNENISEEGAIAGAGSNGASNSCNKKRVIGTFRSGGGYDSSDSSECNTSVASGRSCKSFNSNESESCRENEEKERNDAAQSHSRSLSNTENTELEESSSLTHKNDDKQQKHLNSNAKSSEDNKSIKNQYSTSKSSNETTIDAKTGKKRKRAELIQVRPLPQASDSISSSKVKNNKKNNTSSNTKNTAKNQAQFSHQQRLLCTLASHSGSVLTLRFSSSGTYLASAGDDAHVLLYTKTNKPSILSTGNLLSGNDGKKGEENVEHWDRIRICRGHNLDVVGLAWAPDDSHLVSCSLDSEAPICVWRLNLDSDSNGNGVGNFSSNGEYRSFQGGGQRYYRGNSNSTTLHPFKVLGRDEHTSTVKGVAFDPAGKYVASSGDDPAICIWRAFDDWGLEARVDSSSGVFRSKKKNASTSGASNDVEDGKFGDTEEDMQALANLSLFRRISFAPDGSHVCGTNATLRGKNIAAMISRNGWGVSVPKKGNSSTSSNKGNNTAGAANLVGHKQPVVSSRHCPYLFEVGRKKDHPDDGSDDDMEPKYSTLVALGDKKGFISIWSTKKSRPIFKLQCSESRCTGM